MSRHTPGPWALHMDGVLVLSAGPNRQAIVACKVSGSPNLPAREHRANARLIAAAPEWLEAVPAPPDIQRATGDRRRRRTHYPTADFARAVIAKAEGEL